MTEFSTRSWNLLTKKDTTKNLLIKSVSSNDSMDYRPGQAKMDPGVTGYRILTYTCGKFFT